MPVLLLQNGDVHENTWHKIEFTWKDLYMNEVLQSWFQGRKEVPEGILVEHFGSR